MLNYERFVNDIHVLAFFLSEFLEASGNKEKANLHLTLGYINEKVIAQLVVLHLTDEEIADYYDGIVRDEETSKWVKIHLEVCLTCRQRVQFLKETLAEVENLELDESLLHEIAQNLLESGALQLPKPVSVIPIPPALQSQQQVEVREEGSSKRKNDPWYESIME